MPENDFNKPVAYVIDSRLSRVYLRRENTRINCEFLLITLRHILTQYDPLLFPFFIF